jgi:hypothetical protein
MTTRSILDRLADREQDLCARAEDLRGQLQQLTGHISELEAELADLATTRKVLLTLETGETEHDAPPNVPANPAYQHILTALADAGRPVRAKDLCQALDLGLEPKHIEGMRSKLKRLVGLRLITETEPGLFALPHQ